MFFSASKTKSSRSLNYYNQTFCLWICSMMRTTRHYKLWQFWSLWLISHCCFALYSSSQKSQDYRSDNLKPSSLTLTLCDIIHAILCSRPDCPKKEVIMKSFRFFNKLKGILKKKKINTYWWLSSRHINGNDVFQQSDIISKCGFLINFFASVAQL